jgi:hypothetical protein
VKNLLSLIRGSSYHICTHRLGQNFGFNCASRWEGGTFLERWMDEGGEREKRGGGELGFQTKSPWTRAISAVYC